MKVNRSDLGALEISSSFAVHLAPRAIEGFRPFLTADTAAEALARFTEYRILTATRSGDGSADHMNRLTERALADARLIDPTDRNYAGRPIIIRHNDYNLRLFNGDIGIIRPDPASA